VKYDDETLMAFADGELDEKLRAEITAAIEKDPELARRVAEYFALRNEVAGAYSGVMDQEVPERLRAAARGGRAAPARATGNVVQFPSKSTRTPAPRWSAREWTAMAASLVLGGLLSWQFALRHGGDIATQGGSLVARGALAEALSTQLASNQSPDAAIRIGLTFKSGDGAYCRSFYSKASHTAGLACRNGEAWQLPVTSSAGNQSGENRPASGLDDPALLQAIEARMKGEALDAQGESAAMTGGWK
jgi:hypothetical protein